MTNYLVYLAWLSPEVVVIFTALGIMVADLLVPDSWRRQLGYAAIWGLLFAFFADRKFIVDIMAEQMAEHGELIGVPPLLYLSPYTSILKLCVIASTILTILLYLQQKEVSENKNLGEFLSLILLSCVGMMFMVCSDDLIMVFLAMEFIGIVSYILVGFVRTDVRAGEAAIKFFLIGAFSSAIMVYGMSFIYGLTGSTSITVIGKLISSGAVPNSMLLKMGVLLVLVGLGFKLALVPFHSWLPDAMQGATSAISGFISVAPKAAGLAVVVRVFGEAFPLTKLELVGLLSFISIVTMTFGNLMALHQTDLKRLLGYSSVAHIGYILVGVIAANKLGASGVAIYVIAYLLMNLGAFGCIIAVANKTGSTDIEDYAGLSHRNLPMALILVLFLLSLGGLPPTVGFIGKWYVFAAAIQTMQATNGTLTSPYLWLTVFGLLNSVVAIYYYLRVVYQMFFREPRENTGIECSPLLWLGTGFAAVFILVLGIAPQIFVGAAEAAASKLTIY